MWILIISLILLGIIALIAGYIRNKRLQQKIKRGELDRMPEVKEVDAECCGQHEVCERDSLLAAVMKNWTSSSVVKAICIRKKKQSSSVMCYIPQKTTKLPAGYVVFNFVVSSCRIISKTKYF